MFQPYGGAYPPSQPVFFIQSDLNPNLVLDIEGGNNNRGAKLIVWNRKASDYNNQLFTFTPEGFIQNVQSQLVLDIEGGVGAGNKIIQWDKKPVHEAGNQRWQYDYGNHTFHCQGLVLDIEGGFGNAGAKVIAWNPKGSGDNINQRWTLVPVQGPPVPAYPQPIQPVQPIGVIVGPTPAYPIGIPQPGGHHHHHGGGGGNVLIQSTWNDLVLDVEGGSTSPGAHVILYNRKSGRNANQEWRLTPDGFIESALTGYVLDVKGGGGAGSHVVVNPRNFSHTQKFHFEGELIRGHGGLVLDIEGGNRNPGAKLCVWHSKGHHENHNQRFRIVPA